MGLCKRLIARLDVKGNRLIKGIRFEGLRVLGDPCEAALRYSNEGADELLYIDAVASLYGRNGLADVLRQTSREVFIPVTAGGGVRSVADAASLLASGADKIAVNTAALQRPQLITELAEAFGSQCVVASIQARRIGPGHWEAMAESGRERSGRDVLTWIEEVQRLGVGELLLTSVDQDGTCLGPDEELLAKVGSISDVPFIFGGGFAKTKEVINAWNNPKLSGTCIGAALHQQKLELSAIKQDLIQASNTNTRPEYSTTFEYNKLPLEGMIIGVIDYGMGNQQSLINAFIKLGANVLLSDQPEQLSKCNLLALPGVGAFPQGMDALHQRKLDVWLKDWVEGGSPLLGICLGMQMLFECSSEFGYCEGLGFLKGQVQRLPDRNPEGQPVILPHMGWNRLIPGSAYPATLHEEISDNNQYFVHSFAAVNVHPEVVMFSCNYGDCSFIAAALQGSIAGFQFHPERSGPAGLSLLANTCLELLHS